MTPLIMGSCALWNVSVIAALSASVCGAPREAPAPDNSASQLISQARKFDFDGQQIAAIARETL